MAGMKTVSVVLLGLCMLATVVADPAWQFSVDTTPTTGDNEGGHLVPDNGFKYKFDSIGSGSIDNAAAQYTDNSFADDAIVYDASSDATNAAPYDYNNNQFATQTVEPAATSYVLGTPEERPEYVYDATAGGGDSLATQGRDVDQAEYVYDATKVSGDDGSSFATHTTTVTGAHGTEHHGPVSFYTPGSESNGAFRFYDARTPEERKATSVLDVEPATGAESFSQQQYVNGDSTIASTASIFATSVVPHGTHGCPATYWATHVPQWPADIKKTTPVCKAFGGLNLRKNLEIIFGTTTVFQALLDTRKDAYSKLLRTGVAALINSHARPAFSLKPATVSKQFHLALASKTLAAEQAQKFENANHAYGDSECK